MGLNDVITIRADRSELEAEDSGRYLVFSFSFSLPVLFASLPTVCSGISLFLVCFFSFLFCFQVYFQVLKVRIVLSLERKRNVSKAQPHCKQNCLLLCDCLCLSSFKKRYSFH